MVSRDAPGPATFNTTHWSLVALAGDSQSPESTAALERLCHAYWPPLYAFIRRQGYAPADAEDLTQEFFARLLEGKQFGAVDANKGKFRTFLLTALTHFLSNQRDRERAVKRGGGRQILSLDQIRQEQGDWPEPSMEPSAEKFFDARWAMAVMVQALKQLRREHETAGKAKNFDVLKEYLTEVPGEGSYTQAAARLGMNTQSVAAMVYRLRTRYRALVRAEIANTVSSPLDVEAEMRHLLEALAA